MDKSMLTVDDLRVLSREYYDTVWGIPDGQEIDESLRLTICAELTATTDRLVRTFGPVQTE